MSSSTAQSHQQTSFRLNGVRYSLHLADCLAWMELQPAESVHAIVTDPPYGLKEYTAPEKRKLRVGKGGVWRIPPAFDGCVRSPLPRFTVLTDDERSNLRHFFCDFARRAFRIMVPGAHLFIATNPLLSHLVYVPLLEAGFEKRGEIIRLVQTLRGGDRPKNAHREFAEVTVMPRSSWEPWGLFRKPCEGRVQDNLRKCKTGGLRRVSSDLPFSDVILSAPTFQLPPGAKSGPFLRTLRLSRKHSCVRSSALVFLWARGSFSIRSWVAVRRLRRPFRLGMRASESKSIRNFSAWR